MPIRAVLLAVMLLVGLRGEAGWTPEVSLRVQGVSGVVPSPDGALVVYAQTRHVVERERSESVSQVWLAGADGASRRQLTFGEKSATAPSFGPDSKHVYFLSARAGSPNIWRMAVDGGEARALLQWRGQIGHYAVSPDGKWVAFAGVVADEDAARRVREKRDFRVVDKDPKNHSIWVVAVGDGLAVPRRITGTERHVATFHWAPDSRTIAFEHWPAPGADEWVRSDLAEVDVASSVVQDLVKGAGSESTPFYSPDGRYLAFVQTPEKARWPGVARLAVMDRSSGAVRLLAASEDERPLLLGWDAGSANLYFAEMKRTRSALYAMPLDGPARLVFEPARGTFFAGYNPNANLNLTGTHWGFAQESSGEAPEAFVARLGGGGPVRVSAANSLLEWPVVGETKAVQWKSKDGQVVEGLLTLPVGYRAGTRVPLILNIHGGPANYFSEVFLGKAGIYPLGAFASRGYAILRPNPRGSGGYGKTFRFANVGDWGGKDYEDIMAGVDHLIAEGIVDGERMAVMGWSYGGFMTSWVITHTNRFRAAAVGAAVTNLWSFTGTSDIPGFLPDYFQGEPWETFEPYRAHSPMTYVKGVQTPSLILHGEADDRVPISQGYEFYNALKRQGVPVQMVVYPRTPHGPTEPKFLADLMERHLEWVARYLGK
jgi:dipeptidyl aminopeptidase/acylaminoacyl peptidase